ncbi:hypothetical protein K402DRAFT_419505 [Aulographum hederae CBS 113979]|uniref:Uncharacterized protein n=1 Tax=Aulographum hederae CBS 113979 TaxID=1176131 RepID=A0A6G1H4R6_9PEZI|nr:hypothetical protein K402DRAFT_419505 [Aulographum hederae CBS 113979]
MPSIKSPPTVLPIPMPINAPLVSPDAALEDAGDARLAVIIEGVAAVLLLVAEELEVGVLDDDESEEEAILDDDEDDVVTDDDKVDGVRVRYYSEPTALELPIDPVLGAVCLSASAQVPQDEHKYTDVFGAPFCYHERYPAEWDCPCHVDRITESVLNGKVVKRSRGIGEAVSGGYWLDKEMKKQE